MQLKKNDGNHHLHGGVKGWDKAIWQAEEFQHQEGTAVKLTYQSPDGEEVCTPVLFSICKLQRGEAVNHVAHKPCKALILAAHQASFVCTAR